MKELRRFTMARVGLGRAGNSLPTREWLDFQLAHARARDAVHYPFNAGALAAEIESAGWRAVIVSTAARDGAEYLRRPGLGRRLAPESKVRLEQSDRGPDAVFIVAGGLSPLAIHRYGVELLRSMMPRFETGAWKLAPVVIVERGRVGVSDEIGMALDASLAVILIGERPGLSSPDSMGVYLTWAPRPGRTDADRNCISNIRAEGLSTGAAAELLWLLMNESRLRRISGVVLKAPDRGSLASG